MVPRVPIGDSGTFFFTSILLHNLKTKIFMEAIILSKDQFEQLIAKIDDINNKLANTTAKRTESYLNNKQFMELLGVSLRTAQTWRDEGKISFSQVGNKIYYKMSDVEKFIQDYRNAAFAKR